MARIDKHFVDCGGTLRHETMWRLQTWLFAYVITVCDEASAERCPIFAGVTRRLHWSFPDPSSLQGSPEEKLAKTREVRDTIKTQIEEWCAEVCSLTSA